MKFITNTKPLADALALGVVNANVSKFHNKSNVVQISATDKNLTINIEADRIITELTLHGSGDGMTSPVVMVDSILFKQLIGTLTSSTTTIEFVEGGIIVHSGSSKFTVPNKADVEDYRLETPVHPQEGVVTVAVTPENWKYVQSHQMYSIAMNFTSPIYTMVWVGDDGRVLVGDEARSIYTQSGKSTFASPCLLKDSIIHLLASLPEGAKMTKVDGSYVVSVSTDGFDMVTQIIPMYESDEVGSYNADIISGLFTDLYSHVTASPETIKRVLNQANLLSSSSSDEIMLTINDGKLLLKDNNVESYIDVNGDLEGVECKLTTDLLYQTISKFDGETIKIYARVVDGQVVGVIFTDDTLFVAMAGND